MSDEFDIVATVFLPHPSFSEAPPNDVCVDAEGRILVATADRLESRPNAGLISAVGARGLAAASHRVHRGKWAHAQQ